MKYFFLGIFIKFFFNVGFLKEDIFLTTFYGPNFSHHLHLFDRYRCFFDDFSQGDYIA